MVADLEIVGKREGKIHLWSQSWDSLVVVELLLWRS